jgi:ATP-dependent Clp protease ATP-binding subunit ClpC
LKNPAGFASLDSAEHDFRQALKKSFPPEFLNRVQVEVFDPLTQEAIEAITVKVAEHISDRVAKSRGIELVIDQTIIDHVAGMKYEAQLGARPIKRNMNDLVEDKLTEVLLDEETTPGSRITLKLGKKGQVLSSRLKARKKVPQYVSA